MKKLLLYGLFVLLVVGVTAQAGTPRGPVSKPLAPSPFVIDNDMRIDANLIDMFVTNHGSFAWDLTTGDPGLTYPKGTDKQAVFASGLWVGALVDGDIRVVVAEYSTEYGPGPMMNQGPATNPNAPEYRVYKIDVNSGPGDTDWDEWPVGDGAPVDEYGDPLLLGDQTLWAVYNDADPVEHSNMSTLPLGIEIQQTTFAYNRTGALGNVVFIKFLVINKGINYLEDAYVALWSDPDLGGAGDDLVGCDTLLSVGYCFNATNNDNTYGATPPCVGYDFFQGPIVPSEGDTAYVSAQPYPGFRNLPMTAFNKYINGTDPSSGEETYNYMMGLDAVEPANAPQPYIHPITGDTTTYYGSGDPVTGEGWIDINESDRRFMLCSGPFDLDPTSAHGDSVIIGVTAQEVVAAIVMGQGTDRLNSITVMKENDDAAQKVFDANFNIPNPPPQPSVYAQARDGYVNLIWGTEADGDVQINEDLGQEFHFEGFNVYQGASVAGPWIKIGTFDEVNEHTYIDTASGDTITADVGLIYMDIFSAAAGGMVRAIIQNGNNTGLVHNLVIDTDAILGGSLVNYRQYYFAVTAYNFEVNNATPYLLGPNVMGWISETLENAPAPVSVIPASQGVAEGDTAEHVAGAGDGVCTFHYIPEYQDEVTGHQYEVTFDTTGGSVTWDCTDLNTNMLVITDEANQSGDWAYPIVDGIMVRVVGPEEGIKGIWETCGAGGVPIDPWDNVAYSWNSTHDFYVSSDAGSDFTRMNWRGRIGTDDWEFRFVDTELGEGSFYYDWYSELMFRDTVTNEPLLCPFEVWNMGPNDDPADDKRIQIAVIDDDESFDWSPGDRIYPFEREYIEPLPDPMEYTWDDDFHIGRIQFNAGIPAPGTVVLFETNKTNGLDDIYRFQTEIPWEVVSWDLDDVKVVPNPYYGHSNYELDPYIRVLKFINLPKECNIRIFNLGGDHVRTLEKDDTCTELIWDLETKHGIPVASGIYIWYIDAPGIGTNFGKFAVFMERETLKTF
jgi:hypothetical protein